MSWDSNSAVYDFSWLTDDYMFPSAIMICELTVDLDWEYLFREDLHLLLLGALKYNGTFFFFIMSHLRNCQTTQIVQIGIANLSEGGPVAKNSWKLFPFMRLGQNRQISFSPLFSKIMILSMSHITMDYLM